MEREEGEIFATLLRILLCRAKIRRQTIYGLFAAVVRETVKKGRNVNSSSLSFSLALALTHSCVLRVRSSPKYCESQYGREIEVRNTDMSKKLKERLRDPTL